MTRVSVIIPSFNLGRFVEQTLDSVVNQDYKDLEIIVVDGVLTDLWNSFRDWYYTRFGNESN